MKNVKFTYVFTLADELELPIVVADTLGEIAKFSGFDFDCLFKACLRNSTIAGMYRIRKVDFRDPEEKFDFEEYADYCKDKGLKQSFFSSLQQFRGYCYGC